MMFFKKIINKDIKNVINVQYISLLRLLFIEILLFY